MIDEEVLIKTVAAWEERGGNQTATAAYLGVSRSCVQDRLAQAAARGLCTREPVMPGYQVKSVSQLSDGDGKLEKEWIKQTQVGPEFVMPSGQIVKGVSALIDAHGNVIQQWIKTKQDDPVFDMTQALQQAFAEYEGRSRLAPNAAVFDEDLLTVYPIADHHLGLYAWARETGENYDLKIGAKLLQDTMQKLVQQAPSSKTAVVLNLGDFFHSDSNENRTRRSGNALDVDTRYARVLRVGVDLTIHCIDLALLKHDKVIVRMLPGNHDPYAALALSIALAKFYANNPRVEVDTDPSPFWWFTFGKVFLGSTHGDMIKHPDMPGVMAARNPKEWGETEYRYIYLGHVHHKSIGGGEKAGVIWETFQTLSPRDAWHSQAGYCSGRSMVAITHHRDHGEVQRSTVAVRGPV